jgi:hypothetical protein
MNMTQYEEHIRDSAPCTSRFDGYDRGDLGREEILDQGTRVVGRMTATQGYKVEIIECWNGDFSMHQILVAGMVVQTAEDYPEAVIVARRWLS